MYPLGLQDAIIDGFLIEELARKESLSVLFSLNAEDMCDSEEAQLIEN